MTRSIMLHRERRLLVPPVDHPWWRSHAQGPTVLPISPTLWRIFFAGRDIENRSHILCADIDPTRDMALIRLQSEPLLALGLPGSFDSAGMMPGAALFVGDRVFLYYFGISLRRDVPYQQAIGLAISENGGGSFTRAFPGPVLSTGPGDPFFTSAPHVTRAAGRFHMHYLSAFAWEWRHGRFDARYHIKHATSTDGIAWMREDRVVLAPADDAEAGIARPWIVRHGDRHHMWFCCRGWRDRDGLPSPPYRLAHAGSDDGLVWRRDAEFPGFAPAPRPDEWDAEMQAYPCAIPYHDELLLFYNGNGFGRTGIGFARVLDLPAGGRGSYDDG